MSSDRPTTEEARPAEPRPTQYFDPLAVMVGEFARDFVEPTARMDAIDRLYSMLNEARAEAAQGAAPRCPECEGNDGWHADWCHMGGAPRAEGLDSERLLARLQQIRANPTEDAILDLMDEVVGFCSPHAELSEGAAPRAEGLDRKSLSTALHSLLPMDPGHWTVWQPDDFGGGKDVPANSAEFADLILARLSGDEGAER